MRQTYRKYLAGQSMSAFRPSLLPLTSRPSPLTFRPRLSPLQFAPRSFPLADRPSLIAPRSFSLAPQCPSRNSINTCPYVSETCLYVVLASTQRLCRLQCAPMRTTRRQYKQSGKCANTTRFLCALSNGHQIVGSQHALGSLQCVTNSL